MDDTERFAVALARAVEEHVEQYGASSVLATPGVYEALAEDPYWSAAAEELLDDEEEE